MAVRYERLLISPIEPENLPIIQNFTFIRSDFSLYKNGLFISELSTKERVNEAKKAFKNVGLRAFSYSEFVPEKKAEIETPLKKLLTENCLSNENSKNISSEITQKIENLSVDPKNKENLVDVHLKTENQTPSHKEDSFSSQFNIPLHSDDSAQNFSVSQPFFDGFFLSPELNLDTFVENSFSSLVNYKNPEIIEYAPLYKHTLADLHSYDPFILLFHSKNVLFYGNQRFPAEIFCKSPDGLFVAVFYNGTVSVLCNRLDKEILNEPEKLSTAFPNINSTPGVDQNISQQFSRLAVFSEFKVDNVKTMKFLSSSLLQLKYKDVVEVTSVFCIFSLKKVFEAKCLQDEVHVNDHLNVMYFTKSTDILSLYQNYAHLPSTPLVGLFLQKPDIFIRPTRIVNIHAITTKIDKYHTFKQFEFIFTNKHLLIFDQELIKDRVVPGVENIQFFNGIDRVFVYLEKQVAERQLFFIESYYMEKEPPSTLANQTEIKIPFLTISSLQLDCKITSLVSSEKMLLITQQNSTTIYELTKTMKKLKTITKRHKTITAINKSHFCMYDYDTDYIELYFFDKIIRKLKFANCISLKWIYGLYVFIKSDSCIVVLRADGKVVTKRILKCDIDDRINYTKVRSQGFICSRSEYFLAKNNNTYKDSIDIINKEYQNLFVGEKSTSIDHLIKEWKDFIQARRDELKLHS